MNGKLEPYVNENPEHNPHVGGLADEYKAYHADGLVYVEDRNRFHEQYKKRD